MKIVAKFRGDCWVCDQGVRPGEKIIYRPDRPECHARCQRKRGWPEDRVHVVTGGVGLRWDTLTKGQIVEHPTKGRLKVIAVKVRWISDHGADFGLAEDAGWLYTAWAMPTRQEVWRDRQ